MYYLSQSGQTIRQDQDQNINLVRVDIVNEELEGNAFDSFTQRPKAHHLAEVIRWAWKWAYSPKDLIFKIYDADGDYLFSVRAAKKEDILEDVDFEDEEIESLEEFVRIEEGNGWHLELVDNI